MTKLYIKKKVFECNKISSCKSCGTCCRIREKRILTKEEDKKLRTQIYEKIGILYMYPLSKYTISISHDEKESLEQEAKRKGIELKIIPKKMKYIENELTIIDWSLDHDICPFFDSAHKKCSIYELRPKVCKIFPEEYKFEYSKTQDDTTNIKFDDAIKIGKNTYT